MVVDSETRDCVRTLASRFHPKKIILFGSRASGSARPDSDTDLLVLIDHVQRPPALAARMRAALKTRFPVDILVRSPQAFRARLAMGDPFFRDIEENGVVLHEEAGC